MKKITIALDGPAGSGKTTTAKIVAEKLGYIYIDTGAMYRAVTLECMRRNIEITDSAVAAILDDIKIELKPSEGGQITLLNGEDVSLAIRMGEITKLVSPVSAMGCVRDVMVAQQRALGEAGGVVMDGRDIGTVVFPDAELKVFLTATIESRAERRIKELREKQIPFDAEKIKEEIEYRDKYDSTRAISPLRQADDAIEMDTSAMNITDQSNAVLNLALKIIND